MSNKEYKRDKPYGNSPSQIVEQWYSASLQGLLDQTAAHSHSSKIWGYMPVCADYCEALIAGGKAIEEEWLHGELSHAEAKRLAINWLKVASEKALFSGNCEHTTQERLLRRIREVAQSLIHISTFRRGKTPQP